MQRCTGLDELILSVNDSRIFGCGRCVVDGCPRMEFFLDRPLIHANLSQSHSVFFARLHSANRLVFALLSQTLSGTQALRSCLWLSRFRSLAECWTRASALAEWLEETEDRIRNKETEQSESLASAEARVQHLAERWRLDTSILFRVCESEEVEMRLAEISVD